METVYVIHPFEAENNDEISLSIGDPVIILERDEEFNDGWWRGRNIHGEEGLFPVNYTSPEPTKMEEDEDTSNDDSLHQQQGKNKSTSPPILSPNITFVSKNLQKAVRQTLLSTTLSPIPPEHWSTEHVADWLTQLGFECAVQPFIEQEITGDILLELSLQSLKELNIDTFGKRFKIHSAILALREEIFRQDPFYLYPSKSSLSTTEPPQKYATHPPPPSSYLYQNEIMMMDQDDFHQKKSTSLVQQENSTSSQGILSVARPSFHDIEDHHNVTPDMEGWLYKQGDKYKHWNKRWFVLKGSNLFYFKSPKDVRMKGIINLRGYRIICDETICSGHYSFKAQHEKERTFYFYADTDLSMKAWIQALMKATISRDYSAPVVSSSTIPTVSLDLARRMNPRPPSTILYTKTTDHHHRLPTSTLSSPPSMMSSSKSSKSSLKKLTKKKKISPSIISSVLYED
ncbi:hypothetical protein BJ944DRAFT_202856 [Cunninghamella echinulata]|nr:hypothetical protein BJ944DRAFT_202856 [Cunninghamella echinulata]